MYDQTGSTDNTSYSDPRSAGGYNPGGNYSNQS